MVNWKKIEAEAKVGTNTRKRNSGDFIGITKSGVMTISSGFRDRLLAKNPKILYALPKFHEGENLIMIEFLEDSEKKGARKITNMDKDTGTSGFAAKSFFNQMGLDYTLLLKRYNVEPIEELEGEWWFFRLKKEG